MAMKPRTCPYCHEQWQPHDDAEPARGRRLLQLCPACFADWARAEKQRLEAQLTWAQEARQGR